MKHIIMLILVLLSVSASAQTKIKEEEITPQSAMLHEIRINLKDTAMLNEKELILSPIPLTPDANARIYTIEERDSIVALVRRYKKEATKY